jgi:hypothetical protein
MRGKIFLFSKISRPALRLPPIHCVLGFLGVKQPGCDMYHLLPSSGEVKNEWSCACSPPIGLGGVDKDNFCIVIILKFSLRNICASFKLDASFSSKFCYKHKTFL